MMVLEVKETACAQADEKQQKVDELLGGLGGEEH